MLWAMAVAMIQGVALRPLSRFLDEKRLSWAIWRELAAQLHNVSLSSHIHP